MPTFLGAVAPLRLVTLCAGLLLALTTAHAAVSPTARWEFETTPGFLSDSSGNARHLTNTGGVAAQPSGGPGTGQAALFSGNNRLTASDSSVWHSPNLTIEAYFRPATVNSGGTRVIVSHHNNTDNQRNWHLAEAGGKLRFAKSTNGSSMQILDAFTLVADHDYFAAVILDATAGTAILVLKDLTTATEPQVEIKLVSTGTINANAPLAIGSTGTQPAGTSFFDGVIDDVRITAATLSTWDLLEPCAPPSVVGTIDRTKAPGYKGIWFALGQYSTYGDKYSGGLGTYTVNHAPIAIYSPVANKTFFTYGGTTGPADRRLLIMAAEYDHATHTVTRPTIVMEKVNVDDPHDNACISIDNDGYLWVFVSGRATNRPGFTYRSAEPYSTDGFARTSPIGGEIYTYPQVWHDPARGFFHLLTRYTNGRELYFRTSPDGLVWSDVTPFAQFGGHYQVSARHGDTIGTFFNRHPGGSVDKRTDLYYMQTSDFGQTWTTAAGQPLALPLTTAANDARVFNYSAIYRLMYGIDLAFDEAGHPVLFYLTSAHYQPGPAGEPRTLHTARWTGTAWEILDLPAAATPLSTVVHNYAAGSLWIDNGTWTIIAPTGADESIRLTDPERFWGHGGELELWTSTDQGHTWTKTRAVTENSDRKHGYVRKPMNRDGRFSVYWADGHPDKMSESHLFFANADGTRRWELPYEMTTDTAQPVEVNPPYLRWQKQHFNAAEMLDDSLVAPDTDIEGDGRPNLQEYAQGTDPRADDLDAGLTLTPQDLGDGMSFEIEYPVNASAFDLLQWIEFSEDLKTWRDIDAELSPVSTTQNGDTLLIRNAHRPSGIAPWRAFYRLRYELDRP